MPIIRERITAVAEDEFALFLIGMRINRPLKLHKWVPAFTAMSRMLTELYTDPASGFLGHEMAVGRTIILMQYWTSVEALNTYSHDRKREHLPARGAFSNTVGSGGDVGIWHETYRVSPGTQECVYHNMPPFGLGKVMRAIPATGNLASAKGRMEARACAGL